MKQSSDPVAAVKRLLLLWWVTFLILDAASLIEKYGTLVRTGSYVWAPFAHGFQMMLLVSVAVWFLPLMAVIRRRAKGGRMQKTVWFSTVMIAVLTSFLVLGLFFPQLMQ